MNNTEQDFDELRKLLKLKRYEQPPPGYFNNFSERVIARLETADRTEFLSADARWARRLVRLLENSPLFAGGFGVAVCSLLIYGVLSFQYVDRASVAMMSDGGAANVTHAALVSKISPTTFTASMDPRFATNISGGSSFGALSLSTQPNNSMEPVMFNPGQ